MDLPIHWQQQWGLLDDNKDGKNAFCLSTNGFSDGDKLSIWNVSNDSKKLSDFSEVLPDRAMREMDSEVTVTCIYTQ